MLPTARLSDPRFAHDSLLSFTIDAATLRGRGDVMAFVPPGAERAHDLPVVVLMHGAYGSHWHWALRGGAHLIARDLIAAGAVPPMALIMPTDGMRGATTGYLPQPDADFEGWIMRDLIDACRALIPGVGDASPLFLSGYSMGGFGALRLGAKHADRVRGISAHASVTHLDQLAMFLAPGSRGVRPIDPEDADVLTWLRRNRARLPPLRFDCGRSDGLLEANQRLARALEAERIAHTFEEHDGAHDFEYYSARLPDTLRFVASILRGP